jgi:hypothetical protein
VSAYEQASIAAAEVLAAAVRESTQEQAKMHKRELEMHERKLHASAQMHERELQMHVRQLQMAERQYKVLQASNDKLIAPMNNLAAVVIEGCRALLAEGTTGKGQG